MKQSKWLVIILFTGFACLLFACGAKGENNDNGGEEAELDNLNEKDFPIVDEEITLDIFTAKYAANVDVDWNDLPVWNKYEDMTNINLNWEDQVIVDSLEEKRNLVLGSGDLPDIFYASQLSNSYLLKYGEQGTFVKLNDLIDEYAPNLRKIMDENPDIEKGMTFPDGNIYSMPGLRDYDFLSMRVGARPWFDQSWLERVDMDIPETTDELYTFLTAVKETDEDVVPYGGRNMSELLSWLRGAFGLNNTGAEYIDLDPNDEGELRFIPTADEYKELIEYVHKLFDEALIEQNIFSAEWDNYLANASEGKYASTVFYDPEQTFRRDGFIGGTALEGPHGDRLFSSVASMLTHNGQFVITDANENPEASVRWADYFYSDEGAELLYMGIEDESFTKQDGVYQYVDEIEEANDREVAMSQYVPWVGLYPVGLLKQDYFQGSEASEPSLEAAEKLKPYTTDEIWSDFTYTEDENKFLNSTGNDIEKYVVEMRDKFISGSEKFDDEAWDKYVQTLEGMGLDKYMSIQEDAFERYQDN